MSDTPRTDADDRSYPSPEHAQRIRFDGNECVVMHPEEYESLYEKSRQLERELNAAKRRIKWLEDANSLHVDMKNLIETLRNRDERIKRLISIGNTFVECDALEVYEATEKAWKREVLNDSSTTS